ncbi:MAG: 1-acyl-sn-glycerol-3-phosphate acyltransferase [Desulfobacterales bacterium]|nr:MAG: 1-acyl-sn-glycerol-3-phosphate acyltransferase [Desulfobacterales bacterium]
MDKDQFWQLLKTEFGYQSSPGRPSIMARGSRWRTSVYYLRLCAHLYRQSLISKRGEMDTDRWAEASLAVIRIVESVGGRVHVSGLEGVHRHDGPLVYVANHMSLLETFVLPCVTLAFNRVTFIIKEELLRYPIIKHIMHAVNLIAVSRQNPRQDLKVVLQEGRKFIADGCSVVVFPQATRSVMFDIEKFNSLGVKLASNAGVPVVPIAIKTDFQGNGKWIKDMGPIDPRKTLYFKFGPPMAVEGKGRQVHQHVVDFITHNLRAWGGEVRESESPSRNR